MAMYLCYALLERQCIHIHHVQNVTSMRTLGCWEGIQIIWFIFLKMMTMDSEEHLEHLSTSDCYSSK